jgi:hypothetical protein
MPSDRTGLNTSRSQIHYTDQTSAEDRVLREIEQRQTGCRLQRCLLVFLQEVIVPVRFKLFVVEILKSLL